MSAATAHPHIQSGQHRAAVAPLRADRLAPVKAPERCPFCNSPRVRAKGSRAKKLEIVRLYRCDTCERVFTPGPRALRNKTYPLHEILEALTAYNRGHSLTEVSRRLSSRHGHTVNASTISRWLAAHPDLTTYRRLRTRGLRLFTPPQVIRTIKLCHRQVYEFAYHRAKLEFLRDGTLDGRRGRCAFRPDRRFPGRRAPRLPRMISSRATMERAARNCRMIFSPWTA